MSQSFDIIVIGGGIVGLSAAIAMSQHRLSVALIDASPLTTDPSSIDPRVYAINQASKTLFEKLGVWERLEHSRTSPYEHMQVWDALNQSSIHFDARMVGRDRLGTIIEESVIKQALLEELSYQNIQTFPKTKGSAIESTQDGMIIRDSRTDWEAKLLIVADGAASTTRQLLEVPLTQWSYHQEAIVSLVRTEKPHQHTAYQVFHADGPLAFLPLADPHLCSIVWSTPPSRSQSLMILPEQAFEKELTTAFEHKLGACFLESPRYSFPLRMQHVKQYAGPRWILMGDAAHTIHPMAGLGLNVGLADLTAWSALMANEKTNPFSTRVLNAYQRQRKSEVWKMILMMEGLKAIFIKPIPPMTTLRGLGLSACDRLTPLKRFFIDEAAGLG